MSSLKKNQFPQNSRQYGDLTFLLHFWPIIFTFLYLKPNSLDAGQQLLLQMSDRLRQAVGQAAYSLHSK